MGQTSIEWTDETWNPTVGCTRISPGCKNCYAFALHDKRHAAYQAGAKLPEQYAKRFTELQMMPDRLDDPLRWKRPRRVFVNSVSDLFHEDVPDHFIDDVFRVMASCPRHTFQILTKRPDRMAEYLTAMTPRNRSKLPLANVWPGFSAENQEWFDMRAAQMAPLMRAGWSVFVSAEPLLGPITMRGWDGQLRRDWLGTPGIRWVIVGAESGANARPCEVDWVCSLRDQCKSVGVPFFWKQHVQDGKKISLPELDGRQWAEFPESGAQGATA